MGILDNLTPQEKTYYKDLYKVADSDKDGVISGMDALSFFRKSKLSDIHLGKIWTLADSQGKGFLSEEEFYLSLRMIAIFQDNKEPTIEAAQVPGSKLPNFPEYPPPPIAPSGSSNAATVSNNAPSAASSSHQWIMNPQERQHYKSMFKSQDTDNDGFVTGDQARQFFSKSSLPLPELAKVWNLSDVNKDAKLDETEFCVAMHLITYRLKGIPIPDVLPVSLLSSLPPITAEEKKRYSETFRKADPNNDKFVSGEQARKLFGKSGLDTTVLAKIWELSDQDKDHQLSENEFILALFLINSKLKGFDIPEVIPKPVLDSIFTASTSSAAPTPASTPREVVKPNYDVKLDDLAGPATATHTPIMPTGLVPATHLLPPTTGVPTTPSPVQPLPTPVVPVSPALQQPSFVVSPAPVTPVSQPSFVVQPPRSPQVDPRHLASLETRKEELTKELAEEQSQNQQLEQELAAETETLNKVQSEVKQIEHKIGEEKTKGIQLKEQLKYVKMKISDLKVQKEQFDKIIAEKNDQLNEDQELYNMLSQELADKTEDIKRQQEEIARLTSGIEALKFKRKDAKDQLLQVKTQLNEVEKQRKAAALDYSSQEESVRPAAFKSTPGSSKPTSGYSSANETHHSAPATPALPPKQPQPQLQPNNASSAPEFPVAFGTTESFGSSDFGKPFDFNTAAQTFPAEPAPAPASTTATTAPHEDGHAAFGASNFDNPFGQDSFGSGAFGSDHGGFGEIHKFDTGADGFGSSSSFGASSTSLKGSGEKKEDDPFHFDADLKNASDQAADSFGGSATTSAFGAPESWANFDGSSFSSFDAGQSTFGSGFVDEGKDSFG